MLQLRKRTEILSVAAVSLVFTYSFFFEYLPPFWRMHIPYDLEGYHFSLFDSAFLALREGRFPVWDSSQYCGTSFVGNVQAALFYPPTWLMFAANIGRQRLAFWTVEALVFAHVWLAFVLCYVWLRGKPFALLPSLLGAAIFAFSGHTMLQLQHFGLVCGFAWTPLGLWGIDQAAETGQWRPLWKLAVASALCFLAGYPPTWVAFCVCAAAYAVCGPSRWRVTWWTCLALVASLLPCMVQVLPAWEASLAKFHEARFGAGIRNPLFYVPFLLPNFHDYRISAPLLQRGQEYLYLGVPAFLGIALAIRYWRSGRMLPPLAVLAVCLAVLTDPFGMIWSVLRHSEVLKDLCRNFYFLAGIPLAAAAIAAAGLDEFLKRPGRRLPTWLTPAAVCAFLAWALWQFRLWTADGEGLLVGWRSAAYPALLLAPVGVALALLRSGTRGRVWAAGALLAAVAVDYKAFGTSKQFNARPDDLDAAAFRSPFVGLNDDLYRKIRVDGEYRVAVDPVTGPFPAEMRHFGLATPMGFDPMMPARYQEKLKVWTKSGDPRVLTLDPANVDLLRSLGVRYFFTSEGGRYWADLRANPNYSLLGSSRDYFQVFELRDSQPAYRWLAGGSAVAKRIAWTPERREFALGSASGGRFALLELSFPGWEASVDGRPAGIEQFDDVFQAIRVPAGDHRIRFEYHSRTLWPGAFISLLSLIALTALVARRRVTR